MILATGMPWPVGSVRNITLNNRDGCHAPQRCLIVREALYEEYRRHSQERGNDTSDWVHKDGVFYYEVATD